MYKGVHPRRILRDLRVEMFLWDLRRGTSAFGMGLRAIDFSGLLHHPMNVSIRYCVV